VKRTDLPGYDGLRTLTTTVGVVCVSCDGDPFAGVEGLLPSTTQDLPAHLYSGGGVVWAHDSRVVRDGVRRYIDLNLRGSKDLACPRSEVVPEFVSTGRYGQTPIAEGCGRRATYLGDRLISRVDID
jgi:hypothetical protein